MVGAALQDTECAGERLYNSICLPGYPNWPPNGSLPANRSVEEPLYLSLNHPKVVDVSIGRQLFVDNFLVDETMSQGVARHFYSGAYVESNNGQVLKADRPWEGTTGIDQQVSVFPPAL